MLETKQMNQLADIGTKVKDRMYVIRHFMAMSGILRHNFNLKNIGMLENFDNDWDEINYINKINITFNRKLGYHETSEDPNGVRKSFKELFNDNVGYKRGLCHLLYTDYICFPFYDIPVECKDIFDH
jgi:hypothetical protein